jgi:hypothetical protein
MKLDFIDVRRAFWTADARREIYVELPKEMNKPGMVGRLLKSMYGTRDAAQNWEIEYSKYLKELGFRQGKATTCAFFNQEMNLRVVVHGDDFTILGKAEALDWFKERMEQRYEIKHSRIGPAMGDRKSTKILNRVVTWDEQGIQYEPDQRHAEIIIRELGLVHTEYPVHPMLPPC